MPEVDNEMASADSALGVVEPSPSSGVHFTEGWIRTVTGRRLYPLNPSPEDICLKDIAYALSNACRFSGHVLIPYSVAEHSVRVGRRVLQSTGNKLLALEGLLHDSPEYALGDLASPIKRHPLLAGYREAEERLRLCIAKKYGLPETPSPEVKQADLELLATEMRDLMSVSDHELLEGIKPLSSKIVPWSPYMASLDFQKDFKVYGGVE